MPKYCELETNGLVLRAVFPKGTKKKTIQDAFYKKAVKILVGRGHDKKEIEIESLEVTIKGFRDGYVYLYDEGFQMYITE